MFPAALAHHQGVNRCTNQSLKLPPPKYVHSLMKEVCALAGLPFNKCITMHGMKSVKFYCTSKLKMAVK
jgi:hypothetical protein